MDKIAELTDYVWFQNYRIFIGDDSDYNNNAECADGPFLVKTDADSYIHD